jgi:hypothetical protein
LSASSGVSIVTDPSFEDPETVFSVLACRQPSGLPGVDREARWQFDGRVSQVRRGDAFGVEQAFLGHVDFGRQARRRFALRRFRGDRQRGPEEQALAAGEPGGRSACIVHGEAVGFADGAPPCLRQRSERRRRRARRRHAGRRQREQGDGGGGGGTAFGTTRRASQLVVAAVGGNAPDREVVRDQLSLGQVVGVLGNAVVPVAAHARVDERRDAEQREAELGRHAGRRHEVVDGQRGGFRSQVHHVEADLRVDGATAGVELLARAPWCRRRVADQACRESDVEPLRFRASWRHRFAFRADDVEVERQCDLVGMRAGLRVDRPVGVADPPVEGREVEWS